MSAAERRAWNSVWDGASIVDRSVCLGLPVGRGVTNDDVFDQAVRHVDSRLQVFAEECYIVVTCRQLGIVIEQKNEFATHVLLN